MPVLITITNIRTGNTKSEAMDTTQLLSDARVFLRSKSLMAAQDFFLTKGGTEVDPTAEGQVPLSSILVDDVLTVGVPATVPASPDAVSSYASMAGAQRNTLFANIQIFRGLTVTLEEGFAKTFKDLYSWTSPPEANTPRTVTEVQYKYCFNEVTHSLHVFGADTASVSLEAPFGSAQADYSHESSKTTSDKTVTEYITARFLVRKVSLKTEIGNVVVAPDFVAAVEGAVANCQSGNTASETAAYSSLLDVLNEWGYYVPGTFDLGGVLYSTDSTKITEFSDAETEKQAYGGSFKASFDGIGGGASYNHSSGSETTTTSSSKFQDLSINQVGGKPGTTNSYDDWAKSLDLWNYWALASASQLLPSLYLLARGDENAKSALNISLRLIDGYHSAANFQSIQPCLDMGGYATQIETLLNPFG